jgi:hypothetical protein
MKTHNNQDTSNPGGQSINNNPQNPTGNTHRDPSKVDPTKQDERDNDPTRIKPNNDPDKNDPTQPDSPGIPKPPTEPGSTAHSDNNDNQNEIKGFRR